jgi:hypothetical protein
LQYVEYSITNIKQNNLGYSKRAKDWKHSLIMHNEPSPPSRRFFKESLLLIWVKLTQHLSWVTWPHPIKLGVRPSWFHPPSGGLASTEDWP